MKFAVIRELIATAAMHRYPQLVSSYDAHAWCVYVAIIMQLHILTFMGTNDLAIR